MILVPLRQALQHGMGEGHLVGLLAPLAHAGDAAVVVAVLAAGHGVQVDEHPYAVPFCPFEGHVEVFDAADERRPIAEYEVRHGNAHHVHAVGGQVFKVRLGDVGVPVLFHLFPERLGIGFARQPGFVLYAGALEEGLVHPLFQHRGI